MNRLAAHESGHCLSSWALGFAVDEIAITSTGGHCIIPAIATAAPETVVVVAYAGGVAEQLLFGTSLADVLSGGDAELIASARERFAVESGYSLDAGALAELRGRTTSLLFNYEPELRQLAAEVASRRTFTRDALAEYLHGPAPIGLKQFAHLYPKPRPVVKASTTAATAAAGLPPGARWSAEHGCYLSPTPGRGQAPRAHRGLTGLDRRV